MKVGFAHYSSSNDISGVTTWLAALAVRLQRDGVPVGVHLHHVGPFREDSPLAAHLRQAGVKVFLDEHGSDLNAQVAKTNAFLDAWQPTVFLPQCLAAHYAAAMTAGRQGLPWVLTMHSDDPFYWSVVEATGPGRCGGAVVCVSHAIARELQLRRSEEVHPFVIPCGIPIPQANADYGPDRFQVVFSGRVIEEQKRASLVTDTLIRACRQNSRICGLIIGDGPARARCERLVATARMGGRIRFTGRLSVEAVRNELLNSQAALLMSDYEGLPVALIEAMAAGVVPVARMITSGIPELIDDGVTGVSVSADPAAAASALVRLAESETTWRQCSTNARALVEAKYGEDTCYLAWRKVLAELTEKHRCAYPLADMNHNPNDVDSLRRVGLGDIAGSPRPFRRLTAAVLPMIGNVRRAITLASLRRDEDESRRLGATGGRLYLMLAADTRYRQQLEVVLQSVRSNVSSDYGIDVTVLSSTLAEDSIRWKSRRPSDSLRCSEPEIQVADVLPVRPGDHVSQATYFRLFLDAAVPDGVDRVIYLDCDLAVLGNLAELTAIDLCGRVVGAVRSFSIPTLADSCEPLREQPESISKPYFNAGVLVIDMQAWRRNRVRERCLDFLRVNRDGIRYWDQDALNAVLVDDWLEIDPRWNRTSDYWQLSRANLLPFSGDVNRSLANPYIVHFASGSKPWTHYRHPDKAVYDRYLRLAGCGRHRFTMVDALKRRSGEYLRKP